jgi:hypothetical protein
MTMKEEAVIDHIRRRLDGVDVVTATPESGAPEVAWGDSSSSTIRTTCSRARSNFRLPRWSRKTTEILIRTELNAPRRYEAVRI